jgi:hypothetical protein
MATIYEWFENPHISIPADSELGKRLATANPGEFDSSNASTVFTDAEKEVISEWLNTGCREGVTLFEALTSPKPAPVAPPSPPPYHGVAVGRIVHYYNFQGIGPWAAIVTDVIGGGLVDLTIFRSGSSHPDYDVAVPFGVDDGGPRWTWPPRV